MARTSSRSLGGAKWDTVLSATAIIFQAPNSPPRRESLVGRAYTAAAVVLDHASGFLVAPLSIMAPTQREPYNTKVDIPATDPDNDKGLGIQHASLISLFRSVLEVNTAFPYTSKSMTSS